MQFSLCRLDHAPGVELEGAVVKNLSAEIFDGAHRLRALVVDCSGS